MRDIDNLHHTESERKPARYDKQEAPNEIPFTT
jgi:hypothetical protein